MTVVTTYHELDAALERGDTIEVGHLDLGHRVLTSPGYMKVEDCTASGSTTLDAWEIEMCWSQMRGVRTTARLIRIFDCHIKELDAPNAERVLIVNSRVEHLRTDSPRTAIIDSNIHHVTGTLVVTAMANSHLYSPPGDDVVADVAP